MIVYDNREVEVCRFDQLAPGDPFESEDMCLMKMAVLNSPDNHAYNAICLQNGVPYFIEDFKGVHPINAHISIESE